MTVLTLKKKLVLQAIQALRELNKRHYEDSSKKKPLLEDEDKSTLYLQVMLKKIPKSKQIQMIKVNLPHSLVKDSDEICLITGDLDKKNHKAEIEPDVLHYKALLEKHGITHISQVMTLRQLRTEYKPYEAKQKLLAAYDIFLADNRIAECLPRVLGRHFFTKRKFPIQVNLKTSNLKQQIEMALSKKVVYIRGKGNSCSSEVAYLDMDDAEILENVLTMSEAMSKNIPGTWDNIMGIYLKSAKSKAIPLFVSYGNPNSIELPEEKEDDDIVFDDLSTIPNVKVIVYSNGRVKSVRIDEEMEISSVESGDVKDSNLSGAEEQSNSSGAEKDSNSSDAEKRSLELELQELKNECSEMEKFEMDASKEIKSNKEIKSMKRKKRSFKDKQTSPEQLLEQPSQEIKSNEELKPVKQKKRSFKHKPTSPEQSLQQPPQEIKSNEELKPVKQKKKSIKDKSISPEQSLQQPSEEIKSNEELKPVKQKKKSNKDKSKSVEQSLQQPSEEIKSNEELKPVKQKKKSNKDKPTSPEQSLKQQESNRVPLKRKRNRGESAIQDYEQVVIHDNETPVKLTKKRKIEGVNMKRYQDRKESKKNKKKNQSGAKQRKFQDEN